MEFKLIMSFNTILQDLLVENNTNLELQAPPYSENMDMKLKIKATFTCLIKSLKLKHRISSLIFAFHLGKLIESKELTKRDCRKIISEHFWIIAIRTYYIFEVNPNQIYATTETTTAMIRKLSQQEFRRLTLEL